MHKTLILITSALLLLLAGSCQKAEEITEPVTVDPPTEVRVLSSDETSLTFSWKPVEGVEYYTVRLEYADGTYVNQFQTEDNSARFSDLETGTEYRFKVRVKTADGSSDYAAPISAIPGKGEVEPDPDPEPDPEDPDEGDEEDPAVLYGKFLIPEYESTAEPLAFPGAEGGGMYVTGGRGGRVIHVTNLNDSGTGSLRAAVEASGARTVVFDVAGRIDLKSDLQIKNGDITIAGQTAPGDGICISGNTVFVGADNVIIRFIRFRLGTEGSNLDDGSDAIWGRYNENIILDHCSMSWSIDECASFYANRNFTLQWCIVSESLNFSGFHSKGSHGYGGIWGGKDASFHHNLLAHNNSRNARIDHPQIYHHNGTDYTQTHRGHVDYRNNVIYNWGSNSTYGGEAGQFNIVGNYYKPGPGSSSDRKYFVDAYWYYCDKGVVYADRYPELYLEGNYHTKKIDENRYEKGVYLHDQMKDVREDGNSTLYPDNPAPTFLTGPLSITADGKTCYTSTHDAPDAFNSVTEYAGASLRMDDVDKRVTDETRTGTASCTGSSDDPDKDPVGPGIIDTEADAGGWPTYGATSDEIAAVKDTDGDGMPDAFETGFGLDPDDPSDGNARTLDKYGRYTNLEMYLHWLVRDIVAAQNHGADYTPLY